MRPAWSDPAAAAGAAVLAGAVAVAADVAAGGQTTHTAALGLLALVLGVQRVRSTEQGRGANTAATVALLSQPVLHASSTLVPGAPHGSGTAHAPHVLMDTPLTLGQLLVAAVIVMAVTGAEPLLRRCLDRHPRSVARPFFRRSRDEVLPPSPAQDHRRVRRAIGQRLRLRAPPTLLPAF